VNVHHIALEVRDCARAAAFYADVLGLRELKRHLDDSGGLRAVWLAAGSTVIMVERALRGHARPGGTGHLLCFAADDLARWERRLADAGVAVEDRTAYTLYVSDPDGHRVGLSTYVFDRSER
jgi:glyoxylase I family protein